MVAVVHSQILEGAAGDDYTLESSQLQVSFCLGARVRSPDSCQKPQVHNIQLHRQQQFPSDSGSDQQQKLWWCSDSSRTPQDENSSEVLLGNYFGGYLCPCTWASTVSRMVRLLSFEGRGSCRWTSETASRPGLHPELAKGWTQLSRRQWWELGH